MKKNVKLECQVTGNILKFSSSSNFDGYTLAHANLIDSDNQKLKIEGGELPLEFVFDLDDLEHTVKVLRKIADAEENKET